MRDFRWTIAMLALMLFILPSTAFAQDFDANPLRLVYLNTAGDNGQNSFQNLQAILRDNPRIALNGERDFLRSSQREGLEIDIFRQARQRSQHSDIFARLMQKNDVEGLLIHDAFGGGNTMQVVVIGPDGRELADLRKSIHRWQVDEDTATQTMQEVFEILTPRIEDLRRRQEQEKARQLSEHQKDEEEIHPPLHETKTSDSDAATRPHKLAIQIGPTFGQRSMLLYPSTREFALRHTSPLLGIGLRLDGVAKTFSDKYGRLEFGIFFGFSPFSTPVESEKIDGRFVRIGTDFRYVKALASTTRLRLITGIETLNFSIDANPHYTGNDHVLARLGAGLAQDFGSLLTLQADAFAFPLLMSSHSDGTYGDTSSSFGLGAEGIATLNVFDRVQTRLIYSFHRFALSYPTPQSLDSSAHSHEMLHQAMLSFGYQY